MFQLTRLPDRTDKPFQTVKLEQCSADTEDMNIEQWAAAMSQGILPSELFPDRLERDYSLTILFHSIRFFCEVDF